MQVLAATLGLAGSACGGETKEARLRRDLDQSLCDNGTQPLLGEIRATQDYDYLAVRSVLLPPENYLGEGAFSDEYQMTIEEREAALLIEDEEERLYALEELDGYYSSIVWAREESGQCTGDQCGLLPLPVSRTKATQSGFHHLYSSDGVNAQYHSTADELRAFLGDVDTPHEAALLALVTEGISVRCDDKPNFKETPGGYLIYGETGQACKDNERTGYRVFVSDSGEVTVELSDVIETSESNCLVIGRLPAGLQKRDAEPLLPLSSPIGSYFSEVSALEAASVAAFEQLAQELEHHGAPASLTAWAKRAALEETRHAVLTRKLAERYGCAWQVPLVRQVPLRPLLDIARDNAVEGLTRESFGALLAHHQALRAQDPLIAQVMGVIARDETGHAEFSLALNDWLRTKLSEAERRKVETVRAAAKLRFSEALHRDFDEELQVQAGLPSRETSQKMYALWFSTSHAS